MSEINRLLQAFDNEIEQLSRKPRPVSQRFLDTTAKRMRDGLISFWSEHRRLPETIGELLQSNFSMPEFRRFLVTRTSRISFEQYLSWGVDSFLLKTQAVDDLDLHYPASACALGLVHAVYRAHHPVSRWKKHAKVLTQRGFTEEHVRLVQSDRQVRKAMRKLLQPHND